jgi:hypothetical protein
MDNSAGVKDEFTIEKSGITPSNSTHVTSFSTSVENASTANSTDWKLDTLNANGNDTAADLNSSVLSSLPPIPSKVNESSLLNITDDNFVVSNQSESNRTSREIWHYRSCKYSETNQTCIDKLL